MKSLDKKYVSRFVHLAICAFVLCMPMLVVEPNRQSPSSSEYARMVLLPATFIFFFYLNYSVLIEKFFFTQCIGRFVASNVIAIILLMVGLNFSFFYLFPVEEYHVLSKLQHSFFRELRFFVWNVTGYLLVIGLAMSIKVTAGWYRSEAKRREIERYRTEAELKNLKSQLHPHFLFNTLNNLYSLMQIDIERAQKVVHDLSSLLRYVLYVSSCETVVLGKEMEFLENYIELMRIRLSRAVELHVSLPGATSRMPIAPLLFISLVENAFKHFASNEQRSFISIVIAEEGGVLSCVVENSCRQVTTDGENSSAGIGLVNLTKRLEMIYPGRYTFVYGREGDVYKSCLTINLKNNVA
jgi:sensor histidine kinase YesM